MYIVMTNMADPLELGTEAGGDAVLCTTPENVCEYLEATKPEECSVFEVIQNRTYVFRRKEKVWYEYLPFPKKKGTK